MKHIFILFIGLVYCLSTKAQSIKGRIEIRGRVVDSLTHLPLGYVTVSLSNGNAQPVKSTVTNDDGNFKFVDLETKHYQLVVLSIGYNSKRINLSDTSASLIQLGEIKLLPSTTQLSGISIIAKKNVIESFAGGFRFNPKDVSINKTGSAVNLLSQVPGVQADDNDDIKIKGNVARVMVNGKLINLSGQELQNYLKSISADRIVNITVNTNPSAKYDAASGGGIIDIELKNKFNQGFFATVSTKYESLPGTYNSFNADYTKNKLTISLGLTYLYRKDFYVRDNDIYNKIGADSNYRNVQHVLLPQKQKVFTPRAEITYNLDSTSFITLAVTFPYFFNKFPQHLVSNNLSKQLIPVNYFVQDETLDYKGNIYTYNLNYAKNFKRIGEQFTVGAFYTKTIFNPLDNYIRNYYSLTGVPDTLNRFGQLSNSSRIYKSSQVQVDYVLPILKGRKFSTGIKNSNSLIDNNNPIENFDFNRQQYIPNMQLSNTLKYKENVAAAYLLFAQDLRKVSYNLGLRYEYTAIDINSTVSDQNHQQHYSNLFPNANLSYHINDNQSLDLSYARKIDRPPYSYLDPFVNTSDINNYSVGNPNLRPSYISNLELQYAKQWNRYNSGFITLSYANKRQVYAYQVTTYSSNYNHVITTYTNANTINSFLLSIVATNKITAWWQLNSSINVSASTLKTDSLSNFYYKPKPYFNGTLTNTFILSKNTIIRLSGFYNSTNYMYQAKLNGLGSINTGIQQTLLAKKLTINFDVYDLFKTRKYLYTVNSNYLLETSNTTLKSRYCSLALIYAIGKTVAKKEVKKLNNDRID